MQTEQQGICCLRSLPGAASRSDKSSLLDWKETENMANKRADRLRAESSRKFLIEIVEGYCRMTKEEKKAGRNQGALRFLKDTMVGVVVLSSNPVKKRRRETFLRYFRNMVLPGEYDTLISYTDPERNWQEFRACPYFALEEEEKDAEWIKGGQESPSSEELMPFGGILLPFLLLRDLQKNVEIRLDAYLKQRGTGFYVPGDATARQERAANAKEEAYLDLVYCVQYYEIFLEAFRERLLSGSVQQQEEEAFQAMQEWNRRFTESTDKNEKVMLGGKLLDAVKVCMDALQKKRAGAVYAVLYTHHYINLMALLRLLILAEYVNISHSFTGVADEHKRVRQSKNMERLLAEKLSDVNPFFFHYRDNPNLAVIFRELTTSAERRNVIPDWENPEEINEFYGDLVSYAAQIRRKKADERDAAEEKQLVQSQILLAKPLLCRLAERNFPENVSGGCPDCKNPLQ